jgi:hypothetical protein
MIKMTPEQIVKKQFKVKAWKHPFSGQGFGVFHDNDCISHFHYKEDADSLCEEYREAALQILTQELEDQNHA